MDRPVRRQRLVVEAKAGTKRLRNGEASVLHTPGAKVFSQYCRFPGRAELALNANIGVGGVVLANQRPEEHVAGFVTGQERGPSPRTSDLKFDSACGIARMKMLLRIRPGFSNSAAADRDPVSKRTCIQVQVLAEQILVHVDRCS